jgi:hypothetical protein
MFVGAPNPPQTRLYRSPSVRFKAAGLIGLDALFAFGIVLSLTIVSSSQQVEEKQVKCV